MISIDAIRHSLELFAFFMLTGIFSTLLLPETKGLTLEELSHEPQEGFVKGTQIKWITLTLLRL
jgi:PHS family inorganic phosphate transporter-like MFS transporter